MFASSIEETDFSDGIWNFFHVNDSTAAMQNATTTDSSFHLSTLFFPVQIVLGFMSLLSSLANVKVLVRSTMRKSSKNVLLVSLHVAAFVLSLFGFVKVVAGYVLGIFVTLIVVIDSVNDSASLMCAYFINWITSVLSFWRFVEVRCPHRTEKLLTRKRALIIIVVLVILALSPDIVLNALGALKLNIVGKFSNLQLTNSTALEEEGGDTSSTYYTIIKWVGYIVKIFQYVFPLGSFIATSLYSLKKACTTKPKEDLLLECTSKFNIHLDAAQIKKTFIHLSLLGCYMISTTVEPIIELIPGTGTFKIRFKSIVGGFAFTHITNVMSFFAHYYTDHEFRDSFWKHFKLCRRKKTNEEVTEAE